MKDKKQETPSVVRAYLIAGAIGVIGLSLWLIATGANPFLGVFFLILGSILLFAVVRIDGNDPQHDHHMDLTPWRRRLLIVALAAVALVATFLRRSFTVEAVIAIAVAIILVELILFLRRHQSRRGDSDEV